MGFRLRLAHEQTRSLTTVCVRVWARGFGHGPFWRGIGATVSDTFHIRAFAPAYSSDPRERGLSSSATGARQREKSPTYLKSLPVSRRRSPQEVQSGRRSVAAQLRCGHRILTHADGDRIRVLMGAGPPIYLDDARENPVTEHVVHIFLAPISWTIN